MLDELLTPPEVVDYLKLPSVETLYQWRTRKVGPKATRVGRHLRYRRRDLERWLDDQALEAS